MISKYLDRALYIDILLFFVIIGVLYKFDYAIAEWINGPNADQLEKVSLTLISIGSTFIGFLLTLITVILTFKSSFDQISKSQGSRDGNESGKSIMSRVLSKTEQFYGSDIFKHVLRVCLSATFQVGFAVFVILIVRFNLLDINFTLESIIIGSTFLLITLAVGRSLIMFKLFLNIHS